MPHWTLLGSPLGIRNTPALEWSGVSPHRTAKEPGCESRMEQEHGCGHHCPQDHGVIHWTLLAGFLDLGGATRGFPLDFGGYTNIKNQITFK